MSKFRLGLLSLLAVVIIGVVFSYGKVVIAVISALTPPTTAENPPVTSARWLAQNWKDDQRAWYHHASQGTSTFGIPYDTNLRKS